MIPLTANLRIERHGRSLRLWLPLFVLWLLVLPFLIVALPIAAVVLWVLGRKPFAVFAAWWGVLSAIPGSHIEVNGRRSSLQVAVH